MGAKILIGADIAPTAGNLESFEKGRRRELIGTGLCRLFDEADYKILNLEAPLTDKKSPIRKAGDNFAASEKSVKGIQAIGPDFLGIANNHILDQGAQGLYRTMEILSKKGIAYAGAGATLKEAARPYIAQVNGVRVGIYCCAEHEYSIAYKELAGANPYDPLNSFSHIKNLRKNCDLLLVLYHGGKEYYRYPSPMLQKVFRKFAQCGADCVVAQHTHCIGCKEMYHGKMLVYGQGNFLFDDTDSPYEKTSMVIAVDTDGEAHRFSFIPIQKFGSGVRLANGAAKQAILDGFHKRSQEISNPGNVEGNYRRLAMQMRQSYLFGLAGGFSYLLPVRAMNKLFGHRLLYWAYRGKYALSVENHIDCEAHRELVLKIMQMEREHG